MVAESQPCIVAVDGGGSGCRVSIYDLSGDVLGSALGHSANMITDYENGLRNIQSAIQLAYADAERPPAHMGQDIACLGLAGANVGGVAEQLEGSLPFATSQIFSDREITVQGALGEHDGAVAQVGTGSFFSVRKEGVWRHTGGWGFQLSDDCSGAYLGRKLLRATVTAYDGLSSSSPLTNKILDRFGGTPQKLIQYIQSATPRDYGGYVPTLVEANERGDEVAAEILSDSVSRLVGYLDVLDVLATQRLCLTGGVAPVYRSLLPERYRKIIAEPFGSGLDGAYTLALNAYTGAGKGRI